MKDRETLGKPEEERTASSSTQSASGLGGGTPEGTPSEGRREPRTRDEVPGQDPDPRERREERNKDLERRAPSDEADNSADDGAVRTDF